MMGRLTSSSMAVKNNCRDVTKKRLWKEEVCVMVIRVARSRYGGGVVAAATRATRVPTSPMRVRLIGNS